MSNINDLRKQSAQIVGLCKEAQNKDSDALGKVVRIFNPSIEYLASLYAKNDRDKFKLKIAGTVALMRVASAKIDEENFVTAANDAIISRITTAEAEEEFVDFVDQEDFTDPVEEDFVEIPSKGKRRKRPALTDRMYQTHIESGNVNPLVQRIYDTNFTDQAALDKFIEYVSSVAFKTGKKFGWSDADAEDLAQDVVSRVFVKLYDHELKTNEYIPAFIGKMIRNMSSSKGRKHKKQTDKEVVIAPSEEKDPYAQMSDDEAVGKAPSAEGVEMTAPMGEETSEAMSPEVANQQIDRHVKEISVIMKAVNPVVAFFLSERVKGKSYSEVQADLVKNEGGQYDDVIKANGGKVPSLGNIKGQISQANKAIAQILRSINEGRGFFANAKGLKKFASILRDNLRVAEAKEPETWEEVEDKSLERNREESGLDDTVYATIEAMLNSYRKDKDINVISDKYLEPARTEEGWEPLTEGRLNEDKAKTGTPLRNEEAWGENIRPIDKQKIDRESLVKKETFNLKMYEQNMKTPNKKRILDKDIGVQLDLDKTTILDQVPDGFEPFLSKAFNLRQHKVASSPNLIKKMVHADLQNVIDLDRQIIAVASLGHERDLTEEEKQKIDELKKAKVEAIGMGQEKVNAVAARYYLEKLSFDEEDIQERTQQEEDRKNKLNDMRLDYAMDLGKRLLESEYFMTRQRYDSEAVSEMFRNRPEILGNIANIYMQSIQNPEMGAGPASKSASA